MIEELVSSWRTKGSFDKTQSSVGHAITDRNTFSTISLCFDSSCTPFNAVGIHIGSVFEEYSLGEIDHHEAWAEAQEVYFELLPEIDLLTQQLVGVF
jgi:hypothetical protein